MLLWWPTYADGHWQQVGFEVVGALFGVAATGPDDVWAVAQLQALGYRVTLQPLAA